MLSTLIIPNTLTDINNTEALFHINNNEFNGSTKDFNPLVVMSNLLPPIELRQKRYALQDKLQALLKHLTAHNEFKNIKGCMHTQLSDVAVYHSHEHHKAFYGNLIQCSSVWACPVCAPKIQARRALEISKALHWVYSNGYKAIMVTFTQPHTKGDRLKDIIAKHSIAMNKMKSGSQFTHFKRRTGYAGQIRGLETTYGSNGWHWHAHELWIVSADCNIENEIEFLKNKWLRSCKTAGFEIKNEDDFLQHAFNIIDNAHATDYLQKLGKNWGIDKELTHGSHKRGQGMSPFELLESSDPIHNMLFMEYIRATKGKAQLFWSRGLKDKTDVSEKTDEEINNEEIDKAKIIAYLERELWKCVLQKNARAEILNITEFAGFEGLRQWFANYGFILKPPKNSTA